MGPSYRSVRGKVLLLRRLTRDARISPSSSAVTTEDAAARSSFREHGLVTNRLVNVIANCSRMSKVEPLIRCKLRGNRLIPTGRWPKLRPDSGQKSSTPLSPSLIQQPVLGAVSSTLTSGISAMRDSQSQYEFKHAWNQSIANTWPEAVGRYSSVPNPADAVLCGFRRRIHDGHNLLGAADIADEEGQREEGDCEATPVVGDRVVGAMED